MARAWYDAKCLSPFPGQLDTSAMLIILTRLGWQMLEQMVGRPLQHQVLNMVREWITWLLAWLSAGFSEWC
eukprot:6459173-Lingulodinium_polyedra.AAC.1